MSDRIGYDYFREKQDEEQRKKPEDVGGLGTDQMGAAALRANGLSFMLFGFYTVYSFLFLVMGKAKEGCILGACRQGICFVPVIWLLPMVWGLNGVLYAQPAADVLAAVVTVFMAFNLHRKLTVEESHMAL